MSLAILLALATHASAGVNCARWSASRRAAWRSPPAAPRRCARRSAAARETCTVPIDANIVNGTTFVAAKGGG